MDVAVNAPDKTIISLRHNVEMAGDYLLAMRELATLAGQSGTWIKTAADCRSEIKLDSVAGRLILPNSPPESCGVAVRFDALPVPWDGHMPHSHRQDRPVVPNA